MHSNVAISIRTKAAARFRINATIAKLVIATVDEALRITTAAIPNFVFAFILVVTVTVAVVMTLTTGTTMTTILFRCVVRLSAFVMAKLAILKVNV